MSTSIRRIEPVVFASFLLVLLASPPPVAAQASATSASEDRDLSSSNPQEVETPASDARFAGEEAGGETEGKQASEPRPDVYGEVKRGIAEGEPCGGPKAEGEAAVDAIRRRLYETVCGAASWFDGLFGERRGGAPRRVDGRAELSTLYSEHYGTQGRGRLGVRADLPNLQNRVHAFLGRDSEDAIVQDRSEGFALRSQFFDLESDERWVAGLGYGLPGSYRARSDLRIGVKVRLDPDFFVQARHRRNWFVGDRNLWHFRETVFWSVRDGFGSTTSIDYDRLLTTRSLVRWANIGTVSQVTDGVRYRSAIVVYQNLGERRAIAYETFVRGESDDRAAAREYGVRTIYRHPVPRRPWLFAELIGGYGWIREDEDRTRDGSFSIGVGMEILFGHGDPY